MHSSWDPQKSATNLAARGFDFEFAVLIFERVTLERTDDRYRREREAYREAIAQS